MPSVTLEESRGLPRRIVEGRRRDVRVFGSLPGDSGCGGGAVFFRFPAGQGTHSSVLRRLSDLERCIETTRVVGKDCHSKSGGERVATEVR